MTRRTTLLLLLLVAVAAGGGYYLVQRSEAAAHASPPNTGADRASRASSSEDAPLYSHPRIADAAHILAPFEPRIARMADAFSTDLGIDVHVVTTLDGDTPIESQAVEEFAKRKVSRESPTGGLLVILDPKLGAARIEVGYSLEGVMTDLHMSRVARDQLAPYVSYGSAGMAVMDVLHYLRDYALLAAVRGDIQLTEGLRKTPDYLRYQQFLSGGAGTRTALAALPADADLKKPVTRNRENYAPGKTPQESVAALTRVMGDLAGDPTLELYTEGSRLMRKHYPLAPFEEWQRLESLEKSRPLEYLVDGNLAVVTSPKPAMGFTPVLLRRQQGLWRVDLVETWKNLFFNSDGNYFLRNSNTPYAFGLKQFGRGNYYEIAALSLATGSISGDLALLEGRRDADSALRRAELWLRNGFVFPQALLNYEAALAAAPNDPLILETFGNRAQYLGFPELAIPALEKAGRGVEFDLAHAYDEMNDPDSAQRWIEKALEENPYDGYALEWMEYLCEQRKDQAALQRARTESARVSKLPGRPFNPVVLHFNPENPKFEPDTTVNIGGTTVHDHSHFGVTIHNTSAREVEIESVELASVGTANESGLGDIKNYWTYKSGGNRLRAQEYLYFYKDWGFVVDTGHQHVRYVFHTCWHGVDDLHRVRQCRTQWVDSLP